VTTAGFELRAVGKTFDGCPALSQVSLTLPPGEHMAIVGPSGCGKSTALRLLAGLDAPSAGLVLLDGIAVSEPGKVVRPPHLRGVAMVFQDLALWPNLSAMDNVLLGLSGAGLSRREARVRAAHALDLCGIAELAVRQPGEISGGQQQRVALARALAVQPAFLFLDEPFAGLDLVTKTRLLEQISTVAGAQHLTIVLVTHDPMEARVLCRSAVVLEKGRVREAGPLAQLLRDPQSEILRIFRDHLRGFWEG
jgi:ABC-type Fe3+/spermidine/putrescine transport system ATPase subunit